MKRSGLLPNSDPVATNQIGDITAYAQELRAAARPDDIHVPISQTIDDDIWAAFSADLTQAVTTVPSPADCQTASERRLAKIEAPEMMKLIVKSPHLLRLTEVIWPMPLDGQPGRPPTYPRWVIVAFWLFSYGLEMGRERVIASFHRESSGLWHHFQEWARQAGLPGAESLPPHAPSRYHLRYLTERKATPEAVNRLSHAATLHALWTAMTSGALLPTGRPGLTSPDRSNVVGQDGKAMASPVKPRRKPRVNKMTGEVLPHRWDPAAAIHRSGTREFSYGTVFSTVSTRNQQANQRFVLSLRHLDPRPGSGTEADATEKQISLLYSILARISPFGEKDTGIHGITNDGALAGAAIDRIQRHTGIPVTAGFKEIDTSKGSNNKSIPVRGKNIKARHHKTVDCVNGRLHHIWIGAGGFFEQKRTVDGTSVMVPLNARRSRQRNQSGWHMFAKVSLGCDYCRGHFYQSLNDTDDSPTYRLAEYLRWHDFGDPNNDRIRGYRQDTESLHRKYEDAYLSQRIPAYGSIRQTMVMLAFMISNNIRAYHLHRAGPAARRTAAA